MKRIYVHSNDPKKPTIILLVRAFVEETGKEIKKKEDETAGVLKFSEDENWLFKLLGYPRYTYR